MPNEIEICQKIEERISQDKISGLPEDLLVQILLLVPTKDAVATTILSKRWRHIWKMLPKLVFDDTDNEGDKTVWWFLEKSLQLHKAPVLQRLNIELGPTCPVDVDVGNWVVNAIDRCIRLYFNLLWSAEPTSLYKTLYTCKTLKLLALSNKILVDVPPQASLPSLRTLGLLRVVYKNEDSLVRLLSSCPVLNELSVDRNKDDNVKNFIVKVPSLQFLTYFNNNKDQGEIGGSLVIDSPRLKLLHIADSSGDACLIEKIPPRFDVAVIDIASHPHDDKFLRSVSSVMYLDLIWVDATDAFCSANNFAWLIECKITPYCAEDWVESLMLMLHNSPKLKVLMIDTEVIIDDESDEDLSLWWKQPNSVPGCLSSHLEIFEWDEYGGTREEKQLLTYILANSRCLQTVGISPYSTYDNEKKEKMMEELKSMYRVSGSSQLMFSVQFKWRSMKKHQDYQDFF